MKRRPSKSKTEATAVYEHISSTGHLGSIDDFEVIARESTRNDFFLRVKESLLIKKHKPIMNENEASTPSEGVVLVRGGGGTNMIYENYFDMIFNVVSIIFLV